MRDLKRFWRYYRHPAQRWIREMRDVLRDVPTDDATIVDAPCGDGSISFWLIKYGIGKQFELYDISEHSINVARRMHDWGGAKDLDLTIEVSDVHDVPVNGHANDVWLLINSLYLLPDIDRLVDRMRDRAKTIIAVFPNVASKNYQKFISQIPDMNINEMSVDDTIAFFAKHGYKLDDKRDMDCIPLNYFKSKYTKLSACYILNLFERVLPGKEKCYWIARFSREE
ncbi:MAG: class I SAM-dependent methyltransferase [Planctomycetales bacterium]|nr:class I SAM-dependent methyltransferase [Planctomycetales bacterium]